MSPASFCYEEKFRINDEIITKENLCLYMEKIKKTAEEMVRDGKEHPTVFEMETALSFLYFLGSKKWKQSFWKQGLGDDWMQANVIKHPICTVIASIGYDHTQYLGSTIQEIAGEKAGILKKGCPAVSYDNTSEAREVIEKAAEEKNVPLIFADTSRVTVLSEN